VLFAHQLLLGRKYRYVIFSFSADLATVVVEQRALLSKTYTDSLDDLPLQDV
jgi:hypothetical protein